HQPGQRNGQHRRPAYQQQQIGIGHPDQRVVVEEHVAGGAAAQRGDAGDEADAEPVHVAPTRRQRRRHRLGGYRDVKSYEQHVPRRRRIRVAPAPVSRQHSPSMSLEASPMRQPRAVRALETFGRTRLSENFFMRDFLYSEIAAINGFANLPDDPDLAIAAGRRLCTELLEPLQARFGRISVRSAYRSPQVNGFGNARKLNCGSNDSNFAGHIWDRRDAGGHMGATACIVVNRFIPYYERTGDWEALAWWVHDHLPYGD